MAVRAKAFGMEILAYDPYMPAERIEADGAKAVDLNTMLLKAIWSASIFRLWTLPKGW